MRVALLLISNLWAIGAVSQAPTRPPLVLTYLTAYFLATVIREATRIAFPVDTAVYGSIFTSTSLLILGMVVWLSLQALKKHSRLLRAWGFFQFAAFGLYAMWNCLDKLSTFYHGYVPWVAYPILMEGVFLFTSGLSLALALPISEHFKTHAALAINWLAFGVWQFTYLLQIKDYYDLMIQLNEWLPAAMMVTLFCWLGMAHNRRAHGTI